MIGMQTSSVLPHFNNSVRELADALSISVQAVYAWGGRVPPLRQYEIRDLLAKRGVSLEEASDQEVTRDAA